MVKKTNNHGYSKNMSELLDTKKVGLTLRIEEKLRQQFKVKCAEKGVKMEEPILQFITKFCED